MAGTATALFRNHDFLVDAGIFRLDHGNTVFAMETTHDLLRIALKHLDNDTFTAPASVPLILADQNPVPMEHLAHLTRIQEKIVALAVRHHETEAVTMTLDVSTGVRSASVIGRYAPRRLQIS